MWEIEVGVGGKVLSVRENIVHLVEIGHWDMKARCLMFCDKNSQQTFWCFRLRILTTGYMALLSSTVRVLLKPGQVSVL